MDRDEIEKRLQDVAPELRVAFAARCTLRVLPLLVKVEERKRFWHKKKEGFWYWQKKNHSKYLLATLVAQQVSINFAILNISKLGTATIHIASVYSAFAATIATTAAKATAADAATATIAAIAASIYATTTKEAKATKILANTAFDDVFDATFASASTTGSVHAAFGVTDVDVFAFTFADTNSDIDIVAEIFADLDIITTQNPSISAHSFITSPLWSLTTPTQWQELHKRFNEAVHALNAGFDIWLDWYNDRINGVPLNRQQEAKWLTIPVEIRQQGAKATNAYLASLSIGKEKPLNLVRAIFIGNGAVGKTSLIRTLYNEPVVEGKEAMTAGIEIREWPVPNTKIKARFWDFGGQVMSHSTHQFFLRERCLYILVLDARTEFNANDQAEYWLEHVKAFGKNAPVILVGNKADLTSVNVDMNNLKGKHPNIVGFYSLSCTNQKAHFKTLFAAFHTELVRQLQKVGTHQMLFTDNQFNVLQQLRKRALKETWLSHQAFKSLCRQHEIGKVGLSETDFLGVLDKLGEVIHFPTMPLLNAHILNPRWLTYGVYTVLYSDQANQQQGVVTQGDVIQILQAQSVEDELGNILAYPTDKCGFILQAMEAFQLCYRLPKVSQMQERFAIPDKLPAKQPELKTYFDKQQTGTLAFEFAFRGFLPRHIMPNLIVSRHHEIVSDKDKQLVWQNGVILYNDAYQATARLQVDYHQRVLKLWVQGVEAREFLAILRDEVHKILQRMETLEYDELVALPKEARLETHQLGRFRTKEDEKAPYQRLLAEARKGRQETTSDAGNEYSLQQVLGFIMTKKQQQKEGMNITVINSNVGVIGGSGDGQTFSGKVVLKAADQQQVMVLKDSLQQWMRQVENHEADFQLKMKAYNELNSIREHLDNLQHASAEERSKALQLLDNMKQGTSEAIKLGKEIKEGTETLGTLMDWAVKASVFLAGLG